MFDEMFGEMLVLFGHLLTTRGKSRYEFRKMFDEMFDQFDQGLRSMLNVNRGTLSLSYCQGGTGRFQKGPAWHNL